MEEEEEEEEEARKRGKEKKKGDNVRGSEPNKWFKKWIKIRLTVISLSLHPSGFYLITMQ